MGSRTALVLLLATSMITGQASSKEAEKDETRVFLRDTCPITLDNSEKALAPFISILLSSLVTKAADSLISNLAGAIRKAGEKQDHQYTDYIRTNLYEVADWIEYDGDTLMANPALGCAIVVIGKFDTTKVSESVAVNVVKAFQGDDAFVLTDKKELDIPVVESRLAKAGIYLAPTAQGVTQPAFVYEGMLRRSDDRTALHVESRFLWAQRLQSTSRGTRGLAIGLSMDGPGKDGKVVTLSGALLSLGTIAPGEMKWPWEFKEGNESHLMVMPGLSDASKAALADVKRRRTTLNQLIATVSAELPQIKANIEKIEAQFAPKDDALRKLLAERTKLQADDPDGQRIKDIEALLCPKGGECLKQLPIWDKLKLQETVGTSNLVKWRFALTEHGATNRIFMPIEFTATVTETRDEKKALLFIASVLDGAKTDLSKEITDRLSPAGRAAVVEVEDKEESEYTKALETAELAYMKARSERAALKEDAKPAQIEYADAQVRITLENYNRVRAQGNLAPVIGT